MALHIFLLAPNPVGMSQNVFARCHVLNFKLTGKVAAHSIKGSSRKGAAGFQTEFATAGYIYFCQ